MSQSQIKPLDSPVCLRGDAALPISLSGKLVEFRIAIYEVGECEVAVVHTGLDGSRHHGVPLIRVHSGCLTGDIFGSARCDCGPQLQWSLQQIAAEKYGGVFYIQSHEGRGIGLAQKIKAYELQEQGLDTIDANKSLGFDADLRSFSSCVSIIQKMNIDKIRLITNNPKKISTFTDNNVIVERIQSPIFENQFNEKYINTKKTSMGHLYGI